MGDEVEIPDEEEVAEAPAPAYEGQVELETGRLLSRRITVPLYAFFIFWSVFACGWIGYSLVMQHRILAVLDLVGGPWEGEMPAMDSAAIQDGLAVLKKKPSDTALYVIQELRQDEVRDRRMVRAIALRKALNWSTESSRRRLFDALLENMTDEGELPGDYVLPAREVETLRESIRERTEHPSDSYEETKITEVLQWIADGCPTPAKGPERRRIKALKSNYAKKVFFGREASALRAIEEEWQASGDAARMRAAEKFALMLQGEHSELTAQEAELCIARADYWEGLYFVGRRRLGRVLEQMVLVIAQRDINVDHPHVWDLVRLLDVRDDELRKSVARAVLALKHRKYIFIYLSEFLSRSAINPVMAVETPRLSKAEHEEELKVELLRRRLASLDVLRTIGLDYCRQAFIIEGIAPEEQEDFFKARVITTLEGVLRDKHAEIRARAAKALEDLREAGPQYFE